MADAYEVKRQLNIENNRKLLLSLNLSGPGVNIFNPSPAKPRPVVDVQESDEEQLPTKAAKRQKRVKKVKQRKDDEEVTPRRSQRLTSMKSNITLKTQDSDSSSDHEDDEDGYSDVQADTQSDEEGHRDTKRTSTTPSSQRRRQPLKPGLLRRSKSLTMTNRPDPKVFGHQVGTEVGDWWAMRIDCSQAGVHAPTVAGIAGNEATGCWSIALSGGYEDDVDFGYAFTFTGSGGRDLKGTKEKPKNLRTAPQTSDQQFTALNAALRKSSEIKNPVRVIRGFKNHSPFAPDEGYRYDGLYVVERCWREKGQSNFLVCKYAFVRLPNQPKIPIKQDRQVEANQLFIDMGFKIDTLPESPRKLKPWSQSLALQRRRQSQQVTESSSQDVKEEVTPELECNEEEEEEEESETSELVTPAVIEVSNSPLTLKSKRTRSRR